MQIKHIGVAAILSASVIWAIEPIIAKLSFTSADFLQTSAIRAIFAALTAYLILLFRKKPSLKVRKTQIPPILYIAIVGTLVADLLYFLGLTLVPVINAVLIGHMQPIFILFMAWFALRQDILTKYDYAGIVIMICSAVIVTSGTVENLVRLNIWSMGDMIVLIATITWASAAIVMRRYLRDISTGILTFYRFLLAAVLFSSILFIQGRLGISSFYQIVLGVIIGVGTMLYYEGLKRLKAAQVGALELSTPLFAAGLGIIVLGEQITIFQGCGIGLLCVGIYLLSKKEVHNSKNIINNT
ncbi:MAG: DMT family transporter [Candidatus Thermoplasmatota archaeon]|nr:DMT family transporter [Candidatus Thermoplasmatota archaeon]